MNDADRQNMLKAIAEAERCKPVAARYPKVGAIVAIEDVVLGSGRRDTGSNPKDDDHAEKHALRRVVGQRNYQEPRSTRLWNRALQKFAATGRSVAPS